MQIRHLKSFKKQLINKPILIYGAGKYASIFLTYLQICNYSDYVVGCMVSEKTVYDRELFQIPIRNFDEIVKLKGYNVIVAVSEKNAQSIYSKLEKRDISECYHITSEFVNLMVDEIAAYFSTFPIQEKKVFFDCFEGLGYRCNCKYIAETLKDYNYIVVWNLSKKTADDLPNWITKVKRYSYDYFRELYTAQIYISNDGIEFCQNKRNGQLYICTWHGSGPFKKINIDLCNANPEQEQRIKAEYESVDVFTSSSRFNTEVIRRAFGYCGEVLECGSPRMDCLINENRFREKICDNYKVNPKNKIVLYAPTFRNACIGSGGAIVDSFQKYNLNIELILDALEKRFMTPCTLLYRFHHGLYQYDQINCFFPETINVTNYSDVQELLGAADILITDYSSIMWDFSLQKRPVFLYQNDLEEYMEDRGFYAPVEEWPYVRARTSEELYNQILQFDEDKYIEKLDAFFNKYGAFDDGHACSRVAERIEAEMG